MTIQALKAADGRSVRDGEQVTVTLQRPGGATRTVTGRVRAFEEAGPCPTCGRPLDEAGELRWEIETDDPAYPAIGFLPEHLLARTD